MSDSSTKISVEDRLDIQELFARYVWALDMGDADAFVDCFTADGCFDHLWQGKMHGRDAIRRAVQELWYDRPSWWYARQHLANHFLMNREGQGVRVKAFFSIMQYNVDYRTNFVFGIGNWDNLCVKEADGVWRFQLVVINAWMDRDKVPWKGEDPFAKAKRK
jgi:SnoaL-like domain